VLNSERAIEVNILIMRAFVKLRQLLEIDDHYRCRILRRSERMRYAAVLRFSRMTRGWRAAMRSSATAGPSGRRRPCSQFRSV
jgi:hypothetical protein